MSRDPFLVYRFPETPLGKEDFPFNDIAFNEVGDMLWAWAVGNQGVHLAWRISALSDSRPDSIGRYDWVCGYTLNCLPKRRG